MGRLIHYCECGSEIFDEMTECRSCSRSRAAAGSVRKSFEDWFEADSMPLEHSNWFRRNEDGDYALDFVDYAWEVWKAAIKSQNAKD